MRRPRNRVDHALGRLRQSASSGGRYTAAHQHANSDRDHSELGGEPTPPRRRVGDGVIASEPGGGECRHHGRLTVQLVGVGRGRGRRQDTCDLRISGGSVSGVEPAGEQPVGRVLVDGERVGAQLA
jgi:hypothetical protein